MQHDRARRVITRGPTRVVGKFPSLKSGRSLHWESQLERDRMFQLEFDPDVLNFREQPKTFEIVVGGEPRRYTPDLEVIRTDRKVIEEVKPADRVPECADLFAAAGQHFANRGLFFAVLTEHEIRNEPELANIKLLLRYRRFSVAECKVDEARTVSSGLGPVPLEEFGRHLAARGFPDWAPWWLLSNHLLATDMSRPLSTDNLIFMKE